MKMWLLTQKLCLKQKKGLLFKKNGLWIGIDGKIPFYFGIAYVFSL